MRGGGGGSLGRNLAGVRTAMITSRTVPALLSGASPACRTLPVTTRNDFADPLRRAPAVAQARREPVASRGARHRIDLRGPPQVQVGGTGHPLPASPGPPTAAVPT